MIIGTIIAIVISVLIVCNLDRLLMLMLWLVSVVFFFSIGALILGALVAVITQGEPQPTMIAALVGGAISMAISYEG